MEKRIIFEDTPEVREKIEAEVWANPEKFCLDEDQIHDGEAVMQAVEDHVVYLRRCVVIDLTENSSHDVVCIAMQATPDGVSPYVSRLGHYISRAVDCPFDGLFYEEEVFADEQDIRWHGRNAYGENTALYRVLKDNEQYDAFLQALRESEKMDTKEEKETAWDRAIFRYTESLLPEVAAVLEW